MSNCNYPDQWQALTPREGVFGIPSDAPMDIINYDEWALSFTVMPHPDNQGTVKIGFGETPENIAGLTMPFAGRTFRYNLRNIRVHRDHVDDKVIIIWTRYP